MQKILIKKARIVNPALKQDFLGDIYIKNGKICEVGENLSHLEEQAERVIDAVGLIAAPGFVDMHVHLRDPGFTEKEDIISAGKTAAAGGVTSLLAMPNTSPAVDSPETVKYILEKGKDSDTHVYTSACITKNLQGEELCDLKALNKAGAIAFSDDGRPVINTKHLLSALKQAKEMGAVITAHCEDLFLAQSGLIHEGYISKKLGVPGIPSAAEDCGTAREIAAAVSIGAPIHICHVSTKGSVDLIRDAKNKGYAVTAETAPHYLMFTDEMLLNRDADYRMNPPLRTETDRLAVIAAVRDGTIEAIATDHAPHTPEEKKDFKTAPNGVIGMETSFSAVMTAMDGILSIDEIITLMSVNPAKILGIPAGKIEQGDAADIVIFDPKSSWLADPEKLHGKSKNTPFKDMKLKGVVKYTICGGRLVYECE